VAESKKKKYIVDTPSFEVGVEKPVRGRHQPGTYMSNKQIPGSDTYIELGWIYGMPDTNPYILEHTHDYDEIIVHIGNDSRNREDLGAEIEVIVDGEKITVDKTSAIFVPKGVKHGPLTWKRVDRPHLEMTIMLGAGKVEDAKPGGYLKPQKK
jgi:hypothetical protein